MARHRLAHYLPFWHKAVTGLAATRSACGLQLFARGISGMSIYHLHRVTCESCKRTHKYRNDLLQIELMS